jgi:tetratricopeptide (TPR) repeat protein
MHLKIDSLKEIRSKLAEETNRLRRKLSDYEYMVENAYYFNKFKEGKDNLKRKRRSSADDKLVYESNYLMNKDKQAKSADKSKAPTYIPAEVIVYESKEQPTTSNVSNKNTTKEETNTELVIKEKAENIVEETQKITYEDSSIPEEPIRNNTSETPAPKAIEKNQEILAESMNEGIKNEAKPVVSPIEKTSTLPEKIETKQSEVKKTTEKVVETKEEEIEPTFESLSILEQGPTAEIEAENSKAPILYAKKIVRQDELNLDKVDAMIIDNQIKIARNEISPYKLKMIKGVPAYHTTIDSTSKIKSIAYLNRFKSNILLNDNKQAVKDLEKSLDLDPTNYKAWVFHADLLIIADTQIDAMKEYQIATELNPYK